MTELERARQEVDAAMKGQKTWAEGERPEGLRANLERLVREDERQKCAELAWQMQSKEGRSEIGNAITGRAEEKPAPPAPPAAPRNDFLLDAINQLRAELTFAKADLARAESELASWRRVAEKLEAENQRLRKALTKIRDYAECGCEDHKHPDCCNNADYHCPFCIADSALSEKGSK